MNEKPKLLVILPGDVIGGVETSTYHLLKSLPSFDSALLTQASIADFYGELGIRTYLFDKYGGSGRDRLSPANILRYAWAVQSVSRCEQSDLLLGMKHTGTLFASVAKNLFFLRAGVVGTIHGNVSGHLAAARRSLSPQERWLFHIGLKTPFGIVAPSQGIIDDLIENYGAAPERLRLIYNGVDIARLRDAAQARADIDKQQPWIVSACRLNPHQKDFPTLLAAFKAIRLKKSAKLVLVGDGRMRNDIQRMAEELGVADDLILTGFQENPFPYIAKADVFVLSSFFEGFPIVLMEAMALGIPVVASDCPSGPAEIINDGENGFLIPVGDWQTMAERCLLLLEDTKRREAMIESGLERVEAFGIDAMAAAYDHYLVHALKSKT